LRIEQRQTLAALVVGNADDNAGLIAEELVDGFFDLQMRHHLASDFAEARQAIDDLQEAVGVAAGEIASGVVTIDERLRGAFGIAYVTEHAAGSVDEQESGLASRQRRERFRIHDA